MGIRRERTREKETTGRQKEEKARKIGRKPEGNREIKRERREEDRK